MHASASCLILKMKNKHKRSTKNMLELVCTKYGNKKDSDLTELLDDFAECKLTSKKCAHTSSATYQNDVLV